MTDYGSLTDDQLLKELTITEDTARLTFMAEEAGRLLGEQVIVPLVILLFDRRPLVREGALLGLSHHIQDDKVKSIIQRVAETDPSEPIRSVAADLILSIDRNKI